MTCYFQEIRRDNMHMQRHKIPLRVLGILTLVLAMIGQPVALACTSCGSASSESVIASDQNVSISRAINDQQHSPHAQYHDMSMSSEINSNHSHAPLTDLSPDSSAANHDCCNDHQCPGSHCVSTPAFFSSLAVLAPILISDHPSESYRNAYMGTTTDSPYKPPISS
jgi:hypothetical protein